ncbi:hypothetical protein NIES25_38420 [Nostoc linckia NIES-25]|nr:hypothetical protein NIES25_38420 [Nostoc linckia NIES-25]
MRLVIASPSPVPQGFVEKNGVASLAITYGGIGSPLFWTLIQTLSAWDKFTVHLIISPDATASQALRRMLINTCLSLSLSHKIFILDDAGINSICRSTASGISCMDKTNSPMNSFTSNS